MTKDVKPKSPYKKDHKHITVRNVHKGTWIKFRKICLGEEISAEQKIRNYIESEVAEKDPE